MNVRLENKAPLSFNTELLIVGKFEDTDNLRELDKSLDNFISKDKNFKGKFGEHMIITTFGKIPAKRILVIGIGKKKEFDIERLRRASAKAHKYAKRLGVDNYASTLHNIVSDSLYAYAESVYMSDYIFSSKKEEKKTEISSVILLGDGDKKLLKRARIVGGCVNYARDLVNRSAALVTPSYLVAEASKLKKKGVKVKALGKKEMKKNDMNLLISVSEGSVQEPKLIILEYGTGKEITGIVGKGITFDSGGLSLKPSQHMEDMKSDMAGAAAVLGFMKAAAELKVKGRIVAVIPAAENMGGGKAYKPGDIIRAYNGKTVEVKNTDAEGRLILGDAIAYLSDKYGPAKIIDLATLTGASIVALGYFKAVMMGNSSKLTEDIFDAGESSGDYLWKLPLDDDYRDRIKGEFSDIMNLSKGKGYDAGAITAGAFLEEFVGEGIKWAHIDIAGPSYIAEGFHYHPKGASGFGVRLLLRYFDNPKR